MKLPFVVAFFVSLGATLATTCPAQAEVRRFAVVVGSNLGSGSRPALRFAERDAEKIAEVLSALGGVRANDMALVKQPSGAELRRVLDSIAQQIDAWKNGPGARAIVIFYFSGHSDGQSLELEEERFAFSDLRAWFKRSRADVKLGIIDSCRSGALLAMKGGRPGPSFDVRLVDNATTTGEAMLTSAAADEVALEAAELHGSVFSHHLVSALRGAADASGDGRVTLSEAYDYTFARTVSTTADTLIGPQHPGYDYRLSGRGDLALTELNQPEGGLIEFPIELQPDRILVLQGTQRRVIAELGTGSSRRIALATGNYEMRVWHGKRLLSARASVTRATVLALSLSDFQDLPPQLAIAKGSATATPDGAVSAVARQSSEAAFAIFAGSGFQAGLSPGNDVLPTLRIAVTQAGARPAHLGLSVARNLGVQAIRETHAYFDIGKGLASKWNNLRLTTGAAIGAGWSSQGIAGDPRDRWTALGRAAWTNSISVALGERFAGALQVDLAMHLGRWRGEGLETSFLPTAWLGIMMMQ